MEKKYISILLGILLVLSNYFILLADPIQKDNLFSPQEIEKCEGSTSRAMAAFKEKKYELLHGYFFQPPYYSEQDINNDKEYFITLTKMIEEELGSLKKYSPINLTEIPQDEYDWMCYGESMFSTRDLKSSPGLYLKTYKATFSKIEEIPVYIYVWICLGLDQYSVRDFGVVLHPMTVARDIRREIELGEEIKSLEERKAMFNILFLQERIRKQYAETKGEEYKGKVFADFPLKGAGVKYLLPTEEGEFIIFAVGYKNACEDSEIENALLRPFSKLQEGEQIYTFLTKENEPLKIKFKFKNAEMVSARLELDSIKKEKIGKKEIFVESQGGFLIDFDLEWKNDQFSHVNVHPKVHPFSAGGLSSSHIGGAAEIAAWKQMDINQFKKQLEKELNLDQEK